MLKKSPLAQSPQLPDAFQQDTTAHQHIAIGQIRLPIRPQPRRRIDPEKWRQLVTSVKDYGILEPLVVRSLYDGTYELVAGERRLWAAQEAGLQEVPVLVKDLNDRQALQIALMDNLQHGDLNPFEEAETVLELLAIALDVRKQEVISVLHEVDTARRQGTPVGQDILTPLELIETHLAEIGRLNVSTFCATRLPLLNLPPDVLSALRAGQIEYAKAEAIAQVRDGRHRAWLLRMAIADDLSLSDIKAKTRELQQPLDDSPSHRISERLADLAERMQHVHLWGDRGTQERITQLLDELDKLTQAAFERS